MVDRNYLEHLDLTFLAGKNFDEPTVGGEKYIILNERAVELFKFASPAEAIGQPVYLNDSTELTVIGVVRNFHFRPVNYEIGPLALRCDRQEFGYLSARIVSGHRDEVVAQLEPLWKRMDAVHPLEWKMMADEIDEAYTNSGFVDVVKIVGFISFLAILLACLGMSGMAMYATRLRFKEIGIRKVLGATAEQVTLVLSRNFFFLILIATGIGTPTGYVLSKLFLDNYAYKAPMTFEVIVSGFVVMAALGLLAIGSQTWTAARRNPVESIRYE